MNDILPVRFTFAGTTVDSEPVLKYLFSTEFSSLKYAQRNGTHEKVIDSITYTEFFELALRHYIAPGIERTCCL
jgi:hypothetical protein